MIAEEAYGSGFNSVDIAEANKMVNPNQIEIGQHIILPKVEAKAPTRGEVVAQNTMQPSRAPVRAAAQTEYVVQKGDCLWNIAQKTYGDGFMWTKIAEANALSNPRVIHSGNKLILPAS
ncbi:LysM peptidoglycan-binding domain-containing protein [Candidatus Microgenomates bacterium]|nr:LysM peptidoglycan-binding domain-containing protein [Candidatus Microgenomates bacterium]